MITRRGLVGGALSVFSGMPLAAGLGPWSAPTAGAQPGGPSGTTPGRPDAAAPLAPTRSHVLEPMVGRTAQLLDGEGPATAIWGYQGVVPGPLIRTRQGEVFEATLRNGLSEPTTIHWHGIRNDNAMDGVAYLTQEPVTPGETFAYRFTPPDAGTYWYHPHNRTWEQMARGLYGVLVVEEAEPVAVDRDVVLVVDDWRLDDSGQIDSRSFGSIHDKAHAGRLGNVVTANGKGFEAIPILAGERVRVRLLNAANARIMGVKFGNHTPVVVALDGQPVSPFRPDGDVVLLAPAQRADLIIDGTGEPGDEAPISVLTQREALVVGQLVYDKSKRRRAKILNDQLSLAANPMPTDLALDKAPVTELVMTGGAMSAFETARYQGRSYSIRDLVRAHGKVWAFNGEAGMTEAPLARYARGDTVQIRMVNRTAWPHGMHFHGHHVLEVAHSRRKPSPYWRDTVLMMPSEVVTVAFKAHNPGKWMLHCHMLEHQDGGMSTWFEVG